MIADKNVVEILCSVAGLEQGAALDGADLSAAAGAWLAALGMEADKLNALKEKLR